MRRVIAKARILMPTNIPCIVGKPAGLCCSGGTSATLLLENTAHSGSQTGLYWGPRAQPCPPSATRHVSSNILSSRQVPRDAAGGSRVWYHAARLVPLAHFSPRVSSSPYLGSSANTSLRGTPERHVGGRSAVGHGSRGAGAARTIGFGPTPAPYQREQ
jgi:hypothetical protein